MKTEKQEKYDFYVDNLTEGEIPLSFKDYCKEYLNTDKAPKQSEGQPDKATARPWKWTDKPNDACCWDYHIETIERDDNLNEYAKQDIADVRGQVNAELIVRAVNSHDALVEALEKCKAWHLGDHYLFGSMSEKRLWEKHLNFIDEALKLAKGKSS